MLKNKMYRIEKPNGWLNRGVGVMCLPENKQGKIIGFGANQNGDLFYLVDVDFVSWWKRPTEIEVC